MATLPGYYTLYEAAEIIGVTHSQVARYVRDGRLKAIVVGAQKLIEQADVHQFKRPPVGNPQFREKSAN